MEDDDKVLSGEDAAQCGCCELPFFWVTCQLVYTNARVGSGHFDGSFETHNMYDIFNTPDDWYRKYTITTDVGGVSSEEWVTPYTCYWSQVGTDIIVQDVDISSSSTGPPGGSVISKVYSLSFDHEQAARDALNALFAVDPEPDIFSPLDNNGPFSATVAEYYYNNAIFSYPIDDYINGKVVYNEYAFYVPPFVETLGKANYIKIVWDIARIVADRGTGVVSSASVVETDLECVFTNVLNYGDENDARRKSNYFSLLSHLQAEGSGAEVGHNNLTTFEVVNVRVYRSPSVKQYLTQGKWVISGVVSNLSSLQYGQ